MAAPGRLLLALALTATVARADGPRREIRDTLGASFNLPGISNTLDVSWRWKRTGNTRALTKDAHVTVGFTQALSPSYARLGAWAEAAPLSIFVIKAGIEPGAYFGTSRALLGFPGYDADFSDEARQGRDGEAAWGGRAFVAPSLRLRAGPWLAQATAEIERWAFRADAPFVYEPNRDQIVKGDGDTVLVLQAAILHEWSGAGLTAGTAWRRVEVRAAPGNVSERVGLLATWSRPGHPRFPTVVLQVGPYLQDRFQDGTIGGSVALRLVR